MSVAHNKRYGHPPGWVSPYITGLRTWSIRARKRTPYCQRCGSTEKLHTHHIKAKCFYPELALDPNNAEVLCKNCHIEHHQKYGYK